MHTFHVFNAHHTASDITERPRAPSGVAAFMPSHSKTPYITPSMDFYSRKGVVWGRKGRQLELCLHRRGCSASGGTRDDGTHTADANGHRMPAAAIKRNAHVKCGDRSFKAEHFGAFCSLFLRSFCLSCFLGFILIFFASFFRRTGIKHTVWRVRVVCDAAVWS